METIPRRQFMASSLGAAAVLAAPLRREVPPSERVVLGVMGLGGRGCYLLDHVARHPEVEIAALCDVNKSRFERAAEIVDSASGQTPDLVTDFRRILDRADVDALVVATPVHWHGVATVFACQAGKDVYVEKPASHNAWEGRRMVEAARKHERVVQVGIQNRSAPYFHEALEFVRSGRLGDLKFARVLNMIQGGSMAQGPEAPVPASFDWDSWCGPAPATPYRPGGWYHGRWDFSAGLITDDAVHQLDCARALLGVGAPDSVCHAGGVQVFQDGREIPDTQFATYQCGELTLQLQGTLWAHYMYKTPHNVRDSDQLPDWDFNATKVELFGTEGMMVYGRHGGGWQAFDRQRKEIASSPGRQVTGEHLANWLDCIKTRDRPNADIEDGHLSTLYCHLANASYRAGNRQLALDPGSETFRDQPEANRFLRRTYRAPWTIEEES